MNAQQVPQHSRQRLLFVNHRDDHGHYLVATVMVHALSASPYRRTPNLQGVSAPLMLLYHQDRMPGLSRGE